MNEITVVAEHSAIPFVTHARIERLPRAIIVRWGYVHNHRFINYLQESISLEENPELVNLHDGKAWNMMELINLIGIVTPQVEREGLQAEFITN